jgi:glycosyltransferase involved in cell wall biosynthesis
MSENPSSGTPLVSVCLVTYQHAKFIEKAIRSILSQVVDFQFELLIGEDCSDDGTREICQKYAEKYPDQIKLFLRERDDVIKINGRPTGRYNFCQTVAAAQGKYIALLEGDDFWVDDYKLQTQVKLLEAHPEYSGCFHQVNRISEEGDVLGPFVKQPLAHYQTADLLFKTRHHTSSLVFRNYPFIHDFPEFQKRILLMDRYLAIELSLRGPLAFIDQSMSHYRLHSGGIYTGRGELRKLEDYLTMYECFLENYKQLGRPLRERLRDYCWRFYFHQLRLSLKEVNLLALWRALLRFKIWKV